MPGAEGKNVIQEGLVVVADEPHTGQGDAKGLVIPQLLGGACVQPLRHGGEHIAGHDRELLLISTLAVVPHPALLQG